MRTWKKKVYTARARARAIATSTSVITMGLSVGQAIWISIKPMIKIYFIIGTGFALAKSNIMTVAATRTLSDVVLTVLLPCLSFNKIVSSIEDKDIKDVGIICLSSLLIFGTGLFFAYVCRRLLPVPKQWYGSILAGGMFPNISDLPIAILQTMDQGSLFSQEEGNKGVASVIIFLAMFMICLFNLGGFRLIENDFNYSDEENATHSEESTVGEPVRPNVSHRASQFNIPNDSQSLSSKEEGPIPLSNVSDQGSGGTVRQYDDETSAISRRTTNISQASAAQSVVSSLRSIDLRSMPAQGVDDLIREYSNVDQYGDRRPSFSSSALSGIDQTESTTLKRELTNLKRIITSDATVNKKDIQESGNWLPKSIAKFPGVNFLVFFLKNCLRPCSIAVILALVIAFIPWLKALFVTTSSTPHIRQAPDGQPALNFIMDYTSYVGSASVPFGLMLLGATLGRLKLQKLYPGFWKTAVVLVLLKLCIMPIFGVLWCDRLVKAGWLDWKHDRMLLLVIAMDWGLPTMTTIIYFTASYTPPDLADTTRMDCVAFFLIIQYPLLLITMPFLVTYFLLVQMKV